MRDSRLNKSNDAFYLSFLNISYKSSVYVPFEILREVNVLVRDIVRRKEVLKVGTK